MSWISDVRSKLAALDQSREALVRFGRTMGIALLVLGCLVYFLGERPERGYWLAGIAVVFFLLTLIAPGWLKPIQKGWMTLAFALGWIMSRVLLTIFFIVAITPLGLIMRLVGKNPLKVKAEGGSYWVRREGPAREAKDYERLF